MDPSSLALPAIKKGVEAAIAAALGSASDEIRRRVKAWSSRSALKKATERLHHVRLVKTIWQIDKAVDIFDFYYPARLDIGTGSRVAVERLEEIPADGNLVIQGIVGQGKSIFLRYLTCREAVEGARLPLFVELRRLRMGETLEEHILQELRADPRNGHWLVERR